jgi:MFS family permease
VINGPAFPAITQEFQISFATASYLIAGSSLAYGSASLIWVGVANRYGVRLTFVLCALAGGLVSIWGAKATTFSNLLAARIIASAFLASPEVLAPQVIGDVFHLKYRARAVTTLLVFEGAGFPMGPLIGACIYR